MSESNPHRIDEIRKYASIYGRFDCKRAPTKPLSMHEVSFFFNLKIKNIIQKINLNLISQKQKKLTRSI